MGRAPRTEADLASNWNDVIRQQAAGLSGSFNEQDVDVVQRKLEQQHS